MTGWGGGGNGVKHTLLHRLADGANGYKSKKGRTP